jgi:hypothetical protein
MTVVILGEAEREFGQTVAYYESKEAGLGWRFRTEVVEAVGAIEGNPELARLRPKVTDVAISERFRITSRTSFAVRPFGLSPSHMATGFRSFGSIEFDAGPTRAALYRLLLDLQLPLHREFEDNEAQPGAEGEGGVEEPEVGGGPFLEEAAHPADHGIA